MGKRPANQNQLPAESTRPKESTACTMMWTPNGTICVVGDIEEIVSFHKTFDDALARFIESAKAIVDKRTYKQDAVTVNCCVESHMDLTKKHFQARMIIEPKKIDNFAATTQLAVQFCRVGERAFILHNMEEFMYLTSADDLGTQVPELFLSTPKMQKQENPDKRFVDPRIQQMIDEWQAEKAGTP